MSKRTIWISGQERLDWANDKQHECYELLADVMGGTHHLYNPVKPCSESGIETIYHTSMSTFDFDMLTKFVILAHDRCIRVEIAPYNFKNIKIRLHKRDGREGSMSRRHPTIERAIEKLRQEQSK